MPSTPDRRISRIGDICFFLNFLKVIDSTAMIKKIMIPVIISEKESLSPN